MLKKLNMVVSVLALLALTLAGCKNGMLTEEEATVNGQRGVGGRTATITVTNFEVGMSRTIAPEQITGAQLGTDYYFVATGESQYGSYGPEKVLIDPTTGRFELPGLDPDIWKITLTAYDEDKLQNINAGSTGQEIQDAGGDAKVLVGSAAIDLTARNSSAKITLTPRGITGNGEADLTVVLDGTDETTITQEGYKVKVGIYDKVTGEVVENSEQVFDTADVNNITFTKNDIPVGLYTFKVEIYDENKRAGPWQYTDEIYFEANRDIQETINVPKLIGQKPGDPSKFAVYWYKDDLDNPDTDKFDPTKGTYIVTLAWDRDTTKGNENQFVIQFAGFTTDVYDPLNNTYKKTAAGPGTQITNGDDLWGANGIGGDATKYTEISLETFGKNEYPLYFDDGKGSVIGGSTQISFEVPAGRVYSARIKAKNVEGESGWVYLNTQEPAVGAQLQNPTLLTKGVWVFDVFTVKYNLGGKMLLEKDQTVDTAMRGKVDYAEYDRNGGYQVQYKAYSDAAAGGYLLFPGNHTDAADPAATDRIQWSQWNADVGGSYVAGDPQSGKYTDPKNVILTPNASGAGSTPGGTADIQSSGSFADGVDAETILVTAGADKAAAGPTATDKLSDKRDPNTNPGIGYTAGTPPGPGTVKLVLPKDTAGKGTEYYLKFAIGEEITTGQFEKDKVKLTDPALGGAVRTGKVDSAEYTIESKQGAVLRREKASGTSEATLDVKQLSPGEYILRVSVGFTSGWSSTAQYIVTVSYQNP